MGDRVRRGEIQKITARGYRATLLDFAESFGGRPLDQLSHKAVERWVEHMNDHDVGPASKATRLSTLRVFARWCVINDSVPIDHDWTLLAPKIRRPRRVPRDLTNDHVARVLAIVRTTRERLLVLLMFGCGLRCVEIHRLNVDDFDPVTGHLSITGKAGHERHVYVPHPVVLAMHAYLREAGHVSGPLIRNMDTNGRLGPERISGLVGRLMRLSGVKVRNFDGRGAHGLRAAGASDLMDACDDPTIVQEFLGHADLSNLHIYLRRQTSDKVKQAQLNRPLSA